MSEVVTAGQTPKNRKKIVLTICGAAMAIVGAIVNGIVSYSLNEKIGSLKSTVASGSSKVIDHERYFERSNVSRSNSEEYRQLLYSQIASVGRTPPGGFDSFRNALIDTLVYGHQAEFGEPPDGSTRLDYERLCALISDQERKYASSKDWSPEKLRESITREEEEAAATFRGHREDHIIGYWKKIQQLDNERKSVQKEITSKESRRHVVQAITLSLQIIGLIIVLAKDLV